MWPPGVIQSFWATMRWDQLLAYFWQKLLNLVSAHITLPIPKHSFKHLYYGFLTLVAPLLLLMMTVYSLNLFNAHFFLEFYQAVLRIFDLLLLFFCAHFSEGVSSPDHIYKFSLPLLPLLSAQKSLSSVLLACHLLPWPLPFPGVLDMSSGLPASLLQERPPSSRCLLRRLTHMWKLALPLRWSLSVTFAFCWLPFSIFWVFNMSTYYFNNKNPHKNLW